jgi:alpha-amylase
MKMGPGDWSPNTSGVKVNGKEMKLCASGFQFAVWEGQS